MDSERYKLILDFATEGFWDWDLKADRAYLSPRYCEMIGFSPGDARLSARITNNDPDENPYTFGISGVIENPEPIDPAGNIR